MTINTTTITQSLNATYISTLSHSKKRKRCEIKSNASSSAESFPSEKEAIKEHAYLRILNFYQLCKAIENLSVRTDGTVVPTSVDLKGATLQVGVAHKKGYQAAHSSAVGALSCDRPFTIYKEVCEEKLFTPKKRRLMEVRGAKQEDFQKIDQLLQIITANPKDKATHKKILHIICKFIPNTIIDGSEVDYMINRTDVLPTPVNQCDSQLEKQLRKKAKKLCKRCMEGDIGAEEATDKFIKKVTSCFNKVKSNFETRYQTNNDHRLKNKIKICDWELEGTQPIDYKFINSKYNFKSKKFTPLTAIEEENNQFQLLSKREK
ncbi:hypothetical protein BN1013_00644 [Candidatus Rubidus massiliensis]|nr:hypothetical protein BN1013_00644 [Candidatus Rubidus massiliensis]